MTSDGFTLIESVEPVGYVRAEAIATLRVNTGEAGTKIEATIIGGGAAVALAVYDKRDDAIGALEALGKALEGGKL